MEIETTIAKVRVAISKFALQAYEAELNGVAWSDAISRPQYSALAKFAGTLGHFRAGAAPLHQMMQLIVGLALSGQSPYIKALKDLGSQKNEVGAAARFALWAIENA